MACCAAGGWVTRMKIQLSEPQTSPFSQARPDTEPAALRLSGGVRATPCAVQGPCLPARHVPVWDVNVFDRACAFGAPRDSTRGSTTGYGDTGIFHAGQSSCANAGAYKSKVRPNFRPALLSLLKDDLGR